jgi:germination protein M
MRRIRVALAVVVVALVAACGSGGGGGSPSATGSAPSASGSASTSASATGAPMTVLAYLVRGEKIGVDGVTVTPVDGAVARAAIEALLAGPDAAATAGGLTTAIPTGTRLLDLALHGSVATVDLSGTFTTGGGSLSMQLRVAQVVYTLTQFPTISTVAFRINGTPVTAIGGEGIVVDPPVGRADFEGVTPQVLVESVWPGLTASSPVAFKGTANTYEAVVQWRVERPDGTVVKQGAIMATSGTGTRGTFDDRLDLGSFTGPAVLVTGGERGDVGGISVDVVRIPFVVG